MNRQRPNPSDIRNEPAHQSARRPLQPDDTPREPALSGTGLSPTAPSVDMVCWRCAYSRAGLALDLACPECGSPAFRPHDTDPDASVWEEVTTAPALAGPPPRDATTYARWLEARLLERDVGKSWAMTGLIALFAGPLAIVASFWGADQSLVGLSLLLVIGPVVEEAVKLAMPTCIVERRPYLFLSRFQVIVCGAAAGLVFAVIENLLYLHVYVPAPSPALVAWRWTACVALHVACSTLAATGLANEWKRAIDARRRPSIDAAARWLILSIILHGSFNALALSINPWLTR